MRALAQSLVPRGLLCALCALGALAATFDPMVTIPPELRSAVVKVAVNSTPCSVTCGLGLKVEELCEITLGGERRNCSLQRSLCLSTWICGLQHVSVPAGRPLHLNCFVESTLAFWNQTYGYTWRWAPGLITTNDLLFEPLQNPLPTLSLAPASEADAGTYRCDMQVIETFRLVKRIYFGLKVIPRNLVDLSFKKSWSWKQKLFGSLMEWSAGNGSREGKEHFWENEGSLGVLLGMGSGLLGGVVVSLVLCCCPRLWRR
ncbi:TMM81 protein, partial [Xiphorhynchus elegans]|nr:TMM81 protein [Xiphorhynchus elegans]